MGLHRATDVKQRSARRRNDSSREEGRSVKVGADAAFDCRQQFLVVVGATRSPTKPRLLRTVDAKDNDCCEFD